MKTRRACLGIAVATAMLLGLASTADARRRQKKDLNAKQVKLYWDAAQALYGMGLKIKRSRKKTTISPKRRGLTQAKYNAYVKIYLKVLRGSIAPLKRPLYRFAKNYAASKYDTTSATKLAHIILEPLLKLSLCNELIAKTESQPSTVESYRRISWCAYQSMLDVIAPTFEYRGKKVTWKESQDRGNLKIGDVIWKKDASGNYPIVVTVRGRRKMYSQKTIDILQYLAKSVDGNFAKKIDKKSRKLSKKAIKQLHKILARVAKKQRKLMRGKKIIFAAKHFYDQIATPPAKGPLKCDSTYFLAFSPRKARKQGYHLSVGVRKIECSATYLDAKRHYRGGVGCTRYLKKGRNKVWVAMHYSLDKFNYSRREWRRHRSGRGYVNKRIGYTKTGRGKLLYSNSIICIK